MQLTSAAGRPSDSLWSSQLNASTCTLLAYLHRVKGDWERAQMVSERALALCRQWGVTLWAPVLTGSLGAAYAQSGDVMRGLILIQEALAQYKVMGVGFFHTLVMVLLGETYIGAQRMEEALDCAERVLALSRQRGERGYEAWTLRLLGEVASRRGPPDASGAATYYGLALGRAQDLGMRPLVAHCHFGLGKLRSREGNRDRAAEHLTSARALYREMGMSFWLPQVEAVLG